MTRYTSSAGPINPIVGKKYCETDHFKYTRMRCVPRCPGFWGGFTTTSTVIVVFVVVVVCIIVVVVAVAFFGVVPVLLLLLFVVDPHMFLCLFCFRFFLPHPCCYCSVLSPFFFRFFSPQPGLTYCVNLKSEM